MKGFTSWKTASKTFSTLSTDKYMKKTFQDELKENSSLLPTFWHHTTKSSYTQFISQHFFGRWQAWRGTWKVNTQRMVPMQAYPHGERWCGPVASGHVLRLIKAWKAPRRMIEKRTSWVTMWLSTKSSLLSE